MPIGAGEEITQPATEIDTSVVIGWLHTVPFYLERKANITEEKIGRDSND